MRTLVLVRRDVRIEDNTALYTASRRSDGGVACLAVCSPGDWARHDDAAVKIDLWLRSLAEMARELTGLSIPLLVRRAAVPADVPGVVVAAARALGADAVFANAEYEVNERERDADTEAACAKARLRFELFHDQVVLPPDAVTTQQGRPYSVFTPFKKAWMAEVARRGGVAPLPAPAKQARASVHSDPTPTLGEFGLTSPIDPAIWPAGEKAAIARLDAFCERRLTRYHTDRDPPGLEATSALSPYLAVGAISPRRCIAAAAARNGGRLDGGKEGAASWISEVVWREFYRHIVVHFPRVSMGRAFKPATDRLPWSYDERLFGVWKAGRTGYPIVDAGMRQLAATGWMHNRVRMIVAMFLTKDLFIDWRWGERHFMRHLADGDLAQNNGGWQWSASTGTDAAPYFRIYNPISQSQTHDPKGVYIRRWVPELRSLSDEHIHDPSMLPALRRHRLDYPEPIVDRATTRDRVVAAFRALST